MRTIITALVVTSAIASAQPAPEPAPGSQEPSASEGSGSAASTVAPTPAPPPAVDPVAACRARRIEMAQRAQTMSDLHDRTRILLSMPDCDHPTANEPAQTSEEPASENVTPGSKRGVALEIHIDTSPVQIGSNSALPAPQPGLFLGYRTPAVTVGVGFEFTRFGTSNTSGSTSTDDSSSSWMLIPGVRARLAATADLRTEIVGELDLGYGQISPAGMASPSIGTFRAQLGPGVRYWLAQSFAVSAVAGLRYDRQSRDDAASMSSQSNSVTGLFSSLAFIGVF